MGFHFYTTSPTERDFAIKNYGFLSEGILGYVAQMPMTFMIKPNNPSLGFANALPWYRLFKPTLGDHFYTTSPKERDNVVANFGYVSEGIACYVLATNVPESQYADYDIRSR